MNYLFHLLLSDASQEEMLGSLMGDFVKGHLEPSLPPDILAGIRLHRAIDTFSHDHPIIGRSKRRLSPSIGHGRGILVDIFYDHFLARNWDAIHATPLAEYAEEVYEALRLRHGELPPGLQQVAPRMISNNWLVSYRELSTVKTVLHRIAQRLSRPLPLERGFDELRLHYAPLESDFNDFLPRAIEFAGKWRHERGLPPLTRILRLSENVQQTGGRSVP